MELPKLEPMTVGQIVAKSFRLYLKNFWWFLGMSILVCWPSTTAHLLFWSYGLFTPPADSGSAQSALLYVLAIVVSQMLGTIVQFWLTIAIFAKISARYLNIRLGFWQAYMLIWPKLKTVLQAAVFFTIVNSPLSIVPKLPEFFQFEPIGVSGAIIYGFVIALLIAMILIVVWLIVMAAAIAAEGISAWQAINRSVSLIRGNVARLIGFCSLLLLVFIGLLIVVWLLNLILTPLWSYILPEWQLSLYVRSMLIGVFMAPLGAAANSLLYLDLRARKEPSAATAIPAGFTQLGKLRTSRLAIASVVLGILGMLIGICLSAAIPGLILGIAALIAIQSRKAQLVGQLKGRGLAFAGITISCLAICLTYMQVLPLFFPLPKISPCQPEEVLPHAQLADLPNSATSVQAIQRLRGDSSGEQYLMFQATAEDIEKFVVESQGIRDRKPEIFDSDNMYLPRKRRSKFRDKKEWQEYSRHEHFRRRSYWPDWFDPTIRLKGRKYDISVSEDYRRGNVVINDKTDTVYIRVKW